MNGQVLGPFYRRENDELFLSPGRIVDGHDHEFDHVTFIYFGKFLIEGLDGDGGVVVWSKIVSGEDRDNYVIILRGKWHRLTCLERGRYGCHYLHHDPITGEIVEKYNGNAAAYV